MYIVFCVWKTLTTIRGSSLSINFLFICLFFVIVIICQMCSTVACARLVLKNNISQRNECIKKKKIKNEIGMKVGHVYCRRLAVLQQPTIRCQTNKSSFFRPLSSPPALRICDVHCMQLPPRRLTYCAYESTWFFVVLFS